MVADDDDFDFFESRGDDTDPNPEVVEVAPARGARLPPPEGSTPPVETGEVTQETDGGEWQKHFERGVIAGRKDYRNILIIVLGESEFTMGVLARIDRILSGKETPAIDSRRPTGL